MSVFLNSSCPLHQGYSLEETFILDTHFYMHHLKTLSWNCYINDVRVQNSCQFL